MTKVKINMVGGGFQHDICSSAGNTPKDIEWIRDRERGIFNDSNLSIHIDFGMARVPDKRKRNYAWVLESSDFLPQLILWVRQNIRFLEENYELIFTHDKRLLTISPKMRLVICNAVPWVMNRKIHPKTKLVSMISSSKTSTPGHRYRMELLNKYRNKVDCFGRDHNPINTKEEGLNDYFFSIAAQNAKYSNFFTEELTDCFATGAIPIFWGSDDIGEIFNEKGIIKLDENFKVEDLSENLYRSKFEYVQDNFERIMSLPTAEDFIYNTYIKNS